MASYLCGKKSDLHDIYLIQKSEKKLIADANKRALA